MTFRESAPVRAVLAAVVGALVFAVALVVEYGRQEGVVLLTDRGIATPVTGLYPVEHGDGVLFAWTRPHASIVLPGIDRGISWRLHTTAHAWRPSGDAPTVRVAVDGVAVLTQEVSTDMSVLDVRIPPRFNRYGATITIDTDPSFVPGPADRRELGVALESTTLVPSRRPAPPRTALWWGIAAMLALGISLVALGAPLLLTVAASSCAAIATAAAFVYGFAAHSEFPLHAAILAIAVAIGLWGLASLVALIRRERLSGAARIVVVVSAIACYLKLLVLLHPAAPTGDGVFHAHRFEYVLSGRFYFTSIAPGDYSFPYPILLYLVASPFSLFAHDTLQRMDLLRIVVTVADAIAGALLYFMVLRATGNRRAGVMAVVWYHLIPMTAWIMTWGNLTNAFGQALFVAALVAIVSMPVSRSPRTIGFVAALAAGALLSHPSTCAILVIVFAATTALYWWRGGTTRDAAVGMGLAGAVAAVVAFAIYYAWFPAVYARELTRVVAASGTAVARATPESPIASRIASVPALAVSYLGWPALAAAAVGAWRLGVDRTSPLLTWLLVGWGGACIAFLLLGIVTPVQMRTHFALFPALALAAAFGSAWAWRRSLTLRAAVLVVAAFAVWIGVRQWIELFG